MSHATWLWTVVQFGGKRVSIATTRSSTPIWATLSRAGNTHQQQQQRQWQQTGQI